MLYPETVEPGTLGLLKRLMGDEALHHFVLVGGMALSLQIGHRKSIDLDLFTNAPLEPSMELLHLLDEGYPVQARHCQKQRALAS